MAEENFDNMDRSLMAAEYAKFERLKAKRDAAEEAMKESIAAQLKQNALKRQIALEARDATRNPDRIQKMRGKDDVWGRDKEIPTGYEDNPYVTVESYSSVDY